MININKVVIWGHKLHSHTHGYVHNAFSIAFNKLGYTVFWFDNSDNVEQFDFSNSLFITEGQVDEKIPIRNDCYYILHFCDYLKYESIEYKRKIFLFISYRDFVPTIEKNTGYPNELDKITNFDSEFIFYYKNSLFIIWGTDLLPEQIDLNIELLNNKFNTNSFNYENKLGFVGQPLYPWDIALDYCNANNIEYYNRGGFQNNVSIEDNQKIIQSSILCPAIQCQQQVDIKYIPCRIFKNISYGRMGFTNHKFVYDFFQQKIIFHEDINKLLDSQLEFEKNYNQESNNNVLELMNLVKTKHTYINRINTILNFFNHISNN